MSSIDVSERVRHIVSVRGEACADRGRVKAALIAAREVEGWLQAQVAGLVDQLAAVESFPEATIAEAARCSLGQASNARERADTLGSTPELAVALENGTITAGHVDAVTRASKSLDDEQRSELFDRADQLADAAAAATADQFADRVRREARRLQDESAEDHLERQRRNVRVSTWTDAEGMWNLRGRFDPVTAFGFSSAIDHAVERLFAETTPPLAPADPVEKHKFLVAHALVELVGVDPFRVGHVGVGSAGADADARGGAEGVAAPVEERLGGCSTRRLRAEIVGVVDADAPIDAGPDGPAVEWAIPIELPTSVLAELATNSDVSGVIVRNGVVLYAPGELNLGRSTRLASRAQRRALRGLYRGCAIPGCSVGFDRCKVHHVTWWRDGGATDFDNLLPVCSTHHSKIHHDDWMIEHGQRRELTLRLPDGTVRNTGPPSRRAP